MSRGGKIGAPFHGRVRRPIPHLKRPLKWISGAAETADPEQPCVTTVQRIVCTDGEEGVHTAMEIVAGRSDLVEMDSSESTMTRIVGQISVNYSQEFHNASPSYQIPFVRFGLVANEGDVAPATWVPPDLWSRADLEDVPWMWLHQINFSSGFGLFAVGTLNLGAGGDSIIELRENIDVDCRINRKIGRDGSIFLVAQSHYSGPPGTNLNAPLVGYVQNLRILSKN